MTRRLHGESGFTLVEMLVAMGMAIIILFALTTILVLTLRQTQRTFTRVDATRRARTATADVENELHSACIGNEAPVQALSTDSSLQFVSYYGSDPTPTPVWHVLTYDPTAHTLTDNSYGVTSTGTGWSMAGSLSTPSTTNTLLTNVTQRTDTNGNPKPVFEYYAYQKGSSDAGGTYWVIPDGTTTDPGTGQAVADTPLSTSGGLSAGDAADTVEVVINLSVGASSESLNNPSLSAVNDQVDDAISLRLTTPPDEVPSGTTVAAGSVPAGYGPCE